MIPSAKKSSKSTGLVQKSTATSEPLLPTPSVADIFTGNLKSSQQSSHSKHSVNLSQVFQHPLYSSSQVAFRASHSLKPDEEKERQTTATSGRLCLNALLFTVHDGSSLKMLRDSLLGTTVWYSKQCALTWKKKVTKSSRLLFQLAPLVRRTEGIGSGLLLTPRAQEGEENQARFVERNGDRTMNAYPNVSTQIAMLPTPQASEAERGPSKLNERGRKENKNGVEWTPRTQDVVGQKTGLKLQPAFVEWMMGYPAGWTELPDSKLLEIQSSRKSQQK